jgi:hypothetical protein
MEINHQGQVIGSLVSQWCANDFHLAYYQALVKGFIEA